jgi:hypothetical protein
MGEGDIFPLAEKSSQKLNILAIEIFTGFAIMVWAHRCQKVKTGSEKRRLF